MMASKRVSPCMEALRSKYKVTDTWLREEPRKYVSHTWKAVERLKHLITKGACFLVGDGSLIDVWKDPWIPWLSNFLPKPNASYNDPTPMKVSCLIDSTFRCWIDTKLSDMFDEETIMAIKKIPIPASQATDKLVWMLDSKGNFSAKSVFNTNQQPLVEDDDGLWKKLWKLKIHERYKVLVWRIATGILPTRLNLTSKMGSGDTSCHCAMMMRSLLIIFSSNAQLQKQSGLALVGLFILTISLSIPT